MEGRSLKISGLQQDPGSSTTTVQNIWILYIFHSIEKVPRIAYSGSSSSDWDRLMRNYLGSAKEVLARFQVLL